MAACHEDAPRGGADGGAGVGLLEVGPDLGVGLGADDFEDAPADDALLVDDAADSPVVDDRGDENQIFGGLMVTYRF